jgi:hypothetical protein
VWNKKPIILLGLLLILAIAETQAVGNVTLVAGTIVKTKYGQLTVAKNMVMASMAAYANGTILFNVTGLELVQVIYRFSLQSYGNGTWNIRFQGIIPIQVTANSASSITYNFPSEQISYTTSQITPLIVIYGPVYPTEAQKVLFIDDFAYTNPLTESAWTIDRYATNINSGISTSGGYLIMTAQTTGVQTVHVTNPIYNAASSTTGLVTKRKMTVSLIPFSKLETPFTASIETGTASLYANGPFPGTIPYGTPIYGSCASSGPTIGNSYFTLTNAGSLTFTHCYNNNGVPTTNGGTLETGLDPTLYTVLTVETAGLFCSTCPDDMQKSTGWVWFRAYQRDNSGSLISSTDKNMNLTTNVSPLSQTNYAFITQSNFNSAATGQVSKIDLVQVQNYGSPVCLSVPGGRLCTSLPPIPTGLGQGLISDIAWLANQIGFGDEQIGAIIMFMVLSTGFAFIPFILTRNYLVGGTGLLLVFTFFIYAGFIPTWMLFIPILFGGVLGVLLVNRLLGSHSLMGGGGSDNG